MSDSESVKIKSNLLDKKWCILSICFVISFAILFVASANSFLYKFNSWVDVNWYITMGRGWLNGKIPYKDLFEQKGPVLYMLFAIISIFPNPYHSTFIFEVISMTLFLWISYKIYTMHVKKSFAIIGIALTCLIVSTCPFFEFGGGAVEEWVLPITAYFIYFYLKYAKTGKQINKLQSVVIGILIALGFWSKFTVLIIPISALLMWFILSLMRKDYKKVFINIAFMLIGFLSVTAMVIAIFVANNALYDMLYCYLYRNIFCYAPGWSIISLYKVYNAWPVFALAIVGIVAFLCNKSVDKMSKIGYCVIAVLQILALYFIKGLIYYHMPVAVFAGFGVVTILMYFNKNELTKQLEKTLVIALVFFCFCCSFLTSNSQGYLGKDRDFYFTYQVADKIRSINNDNPTLYCYKMMDYGFYNALGVVPDEKYFACNNFTEEQFPEMYEAFDNRVEMATNQFVVTEIQTYYSERDLFDDANYQFVGEFSQEYAGISGRSTITVVLLQRE